MSVIIYPNTVQYVPLDWPRCFEGAGVLSLPQVDLSPFNIPTSGTNWTYSYSTLTFKKVSGTNSYSDCTVVFDPNVVGVRPFYIKAANSVYSTPGPPQNNYAMYFGIVADNGKRYGIELTKSCGILPCQGQGGNWTLNVKWDGVTVYTRGINFNEIFFVESDGVNLTFHHVEAGVRINDYSQPLPQTLRWMFEIGAKYVNNRLTHFGVFKGTLQTTIPITWSVPLGGTLVGSDAEKCFSSDTTGLYQVCVDSEFDEPYCVDVVVEPLYFYPVDLNCGNCVFAGDIVRFNSNGALEGTLEATIEGDPPVEGGVPVGTVIDALTWRAPEAPVNNVTLTYSLAEVSITCVVNVVPKFEVTNVVGDTISGLLPGETLQLLTTYDNIGVIWENLDCQSIVTPEGFLTIPSKFTNSCFGSLDCNIRVRITNFPGVDCPNFDVNGEQEFYRDFRVLVDPVFPTPQLGGPIYMRWKPSTPDFRVISKTMEGGCSETHIRNRVPIRRWTATYEGLTYPDICDCTGTAHTCDDPIGTVGGQKPEFRTAKTLDDFWMLTAGQHRYFTLVDPKTGFIWRRVRFENEMERDHIKWNSSQTRTLTLIWNPCCDIPDGICIHNSSINASAPEETLTFHILYQGEPLTYNGDNIDYNP